MVVFLGQQTDSTPMIWSIVLLLLGCLAWVLTRFWHDSTQQSKAAATLSIEEKGFDYRLTPITPLTEDNVRKSIPSPYQPWSSGKFAMTMGIKQAAQNDWLQIDRHYFEEQALRRHLLQTQREEVLQILPGTEDACLETLEFTVAFLTRRFPEFFHHPNGDKAFVCNELTSMTFRVLAPLNEHPLVIAAQLVMEDLNLLMQGFGDDPDEHYLVASFSMAPAGWVLRERIGWPLWKVHSPVPMWQEKLRKPIQK